MRSRENGLEEEKKRSRSKVNKREKKKRKNKKGGAGIKWRREKEKKKKEKKKEEGLIRQITDRGPHMLSKITILPSSLYFHNSKTPFFCFQSHSSITHFGELWVMRIENENKSK